MTAREMWRTEEGRLLLARTNGMRLIVEPPQQPGGPVRFQVLRLGSDGVSEDMIASGVRPDVRTAMAAAEEMAGSRTRE